MDFKTYMKDTYGKTSNFDRVFKPWKKWENVKTQLMDLDTSKLHYVKVPEDVIVIDFDLKDEDGNKSLEKNMEAKNGSICLFFMKTEI